MKYLLIALAVLVVLAVVVVVILLLRRRKDDNADLLTAVIGATVTVTEAVSPASGGGAASFKDTEWAARGVTPETTIAKGEKATVVAVEGVKLILRPAYSAQTKGA